MSRYKAEGPGVTPRPHEMKLTYVESTSPRALSVEQDSGQVPADALLGSGGGTGLGSDHFQKPREACACHPPTNTTMLYQKEIMFLGMGICISPPLHGNPTPSPTTPQQGVIHWSFSPDLICTEEDPSPRAKESSKEPPLPLRAGLRADQPTAATETSGSSVHP